MMVFSSIIINSAIGEREIIASPILLKFDKRPDIKSPITRLFFYEGWADEDYKTNLEREHLSAEFMMDNYIIYYGQGFDKYYLGSLEVDVDKKLCWAIDGQHGKLSEEDVKILSESLFNPDAERRQITLFTPTRASDINLSESDDEPAKSVIRPRV